MRYETDQPRFLVVVGDSADLLTDDPAITVLDRVDRVVLARTTNREAKRLGGGGLTIHSYERESDARRVFALFGR